MKTVYNIFFYAAVFCTISFSFGMELSSNVNENYKNIVNPLENVSISKKDLKKTYCSLEKLVSACSSQGEKTALLDLPLNDKEEKLSHWIAPLSHRKDINLLNFWDLLFNNNVPLNIQDTDGNTPLLKAFYHSTDESGKKFIKWDPQTIFHLLSHEANPVLENKFGESSKKILESETSNEEWLNHSLNRAYAIFFQHKCFLYK